MRHRKKCLLLSGVSENDEENLTLTTVSIFQRHLGLTDFKSVNLKVCYRLGRFGEGHSRPIVIHFANEASKLTVWKNKTKFKGSSLVVREFLTKSRQATFKAAREHFGMSNAWTLDGNVCILTPDGKRIRLTTMQELGKITAKFPKPSTSAKVIDSAISPY
ncbi:unnamed protein product [Diatraea saccharalis]|uniref:Uncharacterized protein n=1 Tax=Diatraea saccharalis TaxID=40085 RepID=A0A9N9R9H4_9NEOP|nr:unnamed protein product [Diatraea saccharalis]